MGPTVPRMCSFLISRFRPGCESFSVFVLVRNLLFVMAPVPASPKKLPVVFGCVECTGFLERTADYLTSYVWPTLAAAVD